ncbi:unnamed protein product [Symbiodinium sp. CCMP2592]|nr:unnamed protein product [Symbiodinium sp. CCMP2592]
MNLPTRKAAKAILVARELYRSVDLALLEASGNLAPARSLRFKKVRRFLSWTSKFCARRFYTLGTLTLAVRLLVTKHGVVPPLAGNFDINSWVTDQSKVLHKLIRRSVKNSWERANRAMALNPDELETQVQAWGADELEMPVQVGKA